MNKAKLLDLADRVEALTTTEYRKLRKVEAEIYSAFNPHMTATPGKLGFFYDRTKTNREAAKKYIISGGATAIAPSYLRSLDSAVSSVPEGWDWAYLDKRAIVRKAISVTHSFAEAATPALALTAACLRARAQAEEA